MDTPEDRPPPPGPARWFQRVLPLAVVVVLVLALAAVVPSVRHQFGLSLSREPASYVELYFARPASTGVQAVCTRRAMSVQVAFVVRSHLGRRTSIAYRVVVNPARKGLRTFTGAGSSSLSPGRSVEVVKTVRLPRRTAYLVSVTLPGLGQELRAHCPAGAR